jgi:GNAT superfamily N-acetyltransferase
MSLALAAAGLSPSRGPGASLHAACQDTQVTTVRQATNADLARVCRTALLAFHDDPLMRWLYPDDEDYLTQSPGAWHHLARRSIAQSCTYTTDDAVAIGMYFPPGRPVVEVEEPPVPGVRPPSPELRARFVALGEAMHAHTPEEPHWYLNVLATHPDWQRQGLGAAIIAPVAELCRAEGLVLHLETQTAANVAYYSHLAFRVTGEYDVSPDGPHMWSMTLPPG